MLLSLASEGEGAMNFLCCFDSVCEGLCLDVSVAGCDTVGSFTVVDG